MPRTRVFELDALRAIAIALVLLVHLPTFVNDATFASFIAYTNLVFPLSFFGLTLFFFVSGYALHYNTIRINDLKGAREFLTRRAIRIYPLYWIAVVAFLVLGIGAWASRVWIITQVCGVQGLLSPRVEEPVITLWFIGVILLYYLIFALVVSSSSGSKQRFCLALLIPLLLFVMLRVAFNLVDFRFFVYYALFFSGFLASKYDVFDRDIIKQIPPTVSVLLFTAMLGLIAGVSSLVVQTYPSLYAGLGDSSTPLTISTAAAIAFGDILGLTFIYALFNISRQILPSLGTTLRAAISGIALSSYCVYLFHRPFFVLFESGLDAASFTALWEDVMLIMCGVPLLFLAGYAIQKGWDTLLLETTIRPPRTRERMYPQQ